MSFDLNKEKMLCMMLIDDGLAHKLSSEAGPAYWRGFIVENRETHKVTAEFRFHYKNEEKNWFRLTPRCKGNAKQQEADLRCMIEDVLRMSFEMLCLKMPEDAIQCFYPPDDEGDGMRTIQWLKEQDLIDVRVERKEGSS